MSRRPTPLTLVPGKHTLPSLVDPAEHAAYIRTRHPQADLAATAGTVLVHQRSVLRRALDGRQVEELDRWVSATLHLVRYRGKSIALCSSIGPGAPATALVVEQLTALGTPAVISVGTAAALRRDLPPGSLVICDRALRGEGTSRHYLPPADYAHPDPRLTAVLARAVADHGLRPRQGPAWTTDALYRESATEARLYARHGVLAADMEAAALFAVGRYRRLPVAAAFAIADSLIDRTPRTDHPSTADGLDLLLAAALDALATCASAEQGPPATRVGPRKDVKEEQRG
ncbi:nucleoside phosphorylase [Kitasatospora sp. NPDC059088]|uniref:nucleoside phosphorylase n=1 Tax=Kitasatospora sp. NPDC059088 TaxID=3346722 RepID=UPI00369D38FA